MFEPAAKQGTQFLNFAPPLPTEKKRTTFLSNGYA